MLLRSRPTRAAAVSASCEEGSWGCPAGSRRWEREGWGEGGKESDGAQEIMRSGNYTYQQGTGWFILTRVQILKIRECKHRKNESRNHERNPHLVDPSDGLHSLGFAFSLYSWWSNYLRRIKKYYAMWSVPIHWLGEYWQPVQVFGLTLLTWKIDVCRLLPSRQRYGKWQWIRECYPRRLATCDI